MKLLRKSEPTAEERAGKSRAPTTVPIGFRIIVLPSSARPFNWS